MANFTLDPDQQRAVNALLDFDSPSVFLTGNAGTGKSTVLRTAFGSGGSDVAILAPTGVAALNAGGSTIHRFLRLGTGLLTPGMGRSSSDNRMWEAVERTRYVVIDEISMVRSDLFATVAERFDMAPIGDGPFGGRKVVLVGDLHQLSPVVDRRRGEGRLLGQAYGSISGWCFTTQAWRDLAPQNIHLGTVHRQTDTRTTDLLTAIRGANPGNRDGLAEAVNDACQRGAGPDGATLLVPRRVDAARVNAAELAKLPGRATTFYGEEYGAVNKSDQPTPMELNLKPGARVVCMANAPVREDEDGPAYVNGDCGVVAEIESPKSVIVQLDRGEEVVVEPHCWTVSVTRWSKESETLQAETIGKYSQMPLLCAWAMSIHKSQGLTVDPLRIDMGVGAFASGQLYVALSRCASFDRVFLRTPIQGKDMLVDPTVRSFLRSME